MSHPPPDLPVPASRTPVHTRRIAYLGYRRDDGLWDFEATIEDRKHHPFTSFEGNTVPPDKPYHRMLVRLTVDDTLRVRDVATALQVTPYVECQGAADPMHRLIGATLGRGWRKALNDALGGTQGCTHVRELLYNAATTALQTVPAWLAMQSGQDSPSQWRGSTPPPFVGGCHAWREDGTVVLRHFPQFHRPSPRDTGEPRPSPGGVDPDHGGIRT